MDPAEVKHLGTRVCANQDRLFIQEKPGKYEVPLQVLRVCDKVPSSIPLTVFQSNASHRHLD